MEQVIFSWEDWDDWDDDGTRIQYTECTFVRDFGPWKAGYVAKLIVIDTGDGMIIEYTSTGETVCEVAIQYAVMGEQS